MTPPRRQRGMVLLVVLFFALLLTSSIATFTRRSVVDRMVARNRDDAARAEALARGGIQLGAALLSLDKIAKQASALPIDSYLDGWYRIRDTAIPSGDDATLTLRIEDSGSRFNLNAVFDHAEGGGAYQESEPFLRELLFKAISELDIPPGEKVYDEAELALALIDWVDPDEESMNGGSEDDYYQTQDPPYRARNRPLLSVDELLLIEGFDRQLVDALRPYVTVFPYVGGEGVNLNTAPTHVLALLFFNDGVDDRLAKDDEVKQILDARARGTLLCGEGFNQGGCTPIQSIVPNANSIFPAPTFVSTIFTIEAEARVGEIRRSVEAVIDRDVTPPAPLSWRVR